MPRRPLLVVAALLGVACSSSAEQSGTGGVSSIIPAALEVTPRPGINSVFKVIALTLKTGTNGPELYAAVRNEGDILACNASFSVELHDEHDEVVGTGISGLMARRFYRFTDGSDTVAACVAPGDVSMVAIPSLTLDPPKAAVRAVTYQSNYWSNLELAPITGVTLTNVKAVGRPGGVAYSGTLVNELDTSLNDPTVAVFPLNEVRRPLGVAYGGSSVVLPPGGTWTFETSAVDEPGVSFGAYPMGGP